MTAAGIGYANAVTVFFKAQVKLLEAWSGRVKKVNKNNAAESRCHLIHQTAGLAEVFILGILPELRKLRGRKATGKQLVEDLAYQHLIGGA